MSKTFQTYLLEQGKTNASDAEKAMLFEQFRNSIYLKEKNEERKTKGKRIEVLAPFELHAKIEHLAKELETSKSKLMLQILEYYFNITWIYPHQSLLNAIRIALGKIDSKYHQLIHFCYAKQNLNKEQIKQLLLLQESQKNEILEKLTPKALEDYFFERLNEPDFLKKVATTLAYFKSKEQ